VFPTIIGDILLPGFTNREVGIYGVVYGILGIIGGVSVAIFLTSRAAFKSVSVILSILGLVTFGFFYFAVKNHMHHNIVLIAVALNGMCCIASYSVVFEYGVRLSPGIGEAISGGMINMLANVMGCLQLVVIQVIIDHRKSSNYLNITRYFIVGSVLLTLILFLSIREAKE